MKVRCRGYAMLLEVMLGLSLFTIAVLFVMRLFPASDAAVAHSIRVVQAGQIARMLMEKELGKDYKASNPIPPPAAAGSKVTWTGSDQVNYAARRGANLMLDYTYQVDVTQIYAPDLWNIEVSVRWSTGTGSTAVTRDVRLETQRGAKW